MKVKAYNPSEEVPISQLRDSLGTLAWDCQSGWLGSDGLDGWSEAKIRMTANNIIESLSITEEGEEL